MDGGAGGVSGYHIILRCVQTSCSFLKPLNHNSQTQGSHLIKKQHCSNVTSKCNMPLSLLQYQAGETVLEPVDAYMRHLQV